MAAQVSAAQVNAAVKLIETAIAEQQMNAAAKPYEAECAAITAYAAENENSKILEYQNLIEIDSVDKNI